MKLTNANLSWKLMKSRIGKSNSGICIGKCDACISQADKTEIQWNVCKVLLKIWPWIMHQVI